MISILRINLFLTVFFVLTGCAGSMPKNIGITGEQLTPCPNKPNCVNSFSDTLEHNITPLSHAGALEWEKLIHVLTQQTNSKIITNKPNYIHATFTSKLMGFVDDVEFYQKNNTIHVRSASRLGYSDLGANRDRIEHLRQQLNLNMK